MEKKQQKQIAEEIIKCFAEEFPKVVDRIPEEWDGIEIRQLAVDWFFNSYQWQNKHSFGNKRMKRRKDYENTVLTKRLI